MKRSIFFGGAALALVSLVGCGGGGDSAGGEGDETRKIVFQNLGTNGLGIMNPDGTGVQQLTSLGGSEDHLDPALSPDGSQIALVFYNRFNYQLAVMNVDGTNLRTLTDGRLYLRSPQWHPDGTRLLYGSSRSAGSSNTRLYTIKTDGTEETQLTAIGEGSLPCWSPDGSKIAFVSSRGGNGSDIYTVRPDGTNLTRLTNTPDYEEWMPRWSPDGTRLVSYASYSASTDDRIHVLNADGSGRAPIGPVNGSRPCWSPSGKKIVFVGHAEGTTFWDIFTMSPDGSNLQNLTNSTVSEFAPNW